MFCDLKRELNFCNGYLSLLYFGPFYGKMAMQFIASGKQSAENQQKTSFMHYSIACSKASLGWHPKCILFCQDQNKKTISFVLH